MEDVVYRVRPHILLRVVDKKHEQVAMADVDGRPVLLVPVTEEEATKVSEIPEFADMEVTAVTREEIEHVCHNHNLSLVGFVGVEPDSLSVVSVEVAGMVLEENS